MKKYIVLMSAAAALMTNCSSQVSSSMTGKLPVANKVYIAGEVWVNETATAPESCTIGYWNGDFSPLMLMIRDEIGSGTQPSGNAVCVSGGDVYVAGTNSESNGNGGFINEACYWKNGVVTVLDHSVNGSEALAVCASGSDVFVAGYISEGNKMVYWKNGSAVELPMPEDYAASNWANVYSICVSGTKLAAAGYYTSNVTYKAKAVFWETGLDGSSASCTVLPSPTLASFTSADCYATSVCVSGTDMYVAGYARDAASYLNTRAVYWKNGVQGETVFALPSASTGETMTRSMVNSIFVSGSDIYAAGKVSDGSSEWPAYWKNGTPTILGGKVQMMFYPGASSVCVSGGDVYIAGARANDAGTDVTAVYWKNDTEFPVSLSSSAYSSIARGIFVVE